MAITFQELKQEGKTEEQIRKIKKLIMQSFLDDRSGLETVGEDQRDTSQDSVK
jgi:hypothetical protein